MAKKEEPFAFGFKAKPKPEIDAAWQAWSQSGRRPADNVTFLEKMGPTLDKAVNMYVGHADPTARSIAKGLALRAAESWDPSKAKLQTHLLTQLQPLRRYAAKRRYPTRVPEKQQYRLQALRDAETELVDEYDRPPTDVELADKTGLNIKQIAQLRKYKAYQSTGQYLETDLPGVVDNAPTDMWEDIVYNSLGTADKVIYEGRTGRNGRPSKGVQQLAKELGVSTATITRRMQAVEKLLASRPDGF